MRSVPDKADRHITAWNCTLSTRIIVRVGSVLILLAIGVSILTFVSMRAIALNELQAKGHALADTLNFSFETILDQQNLIGLQRVADNSTSIEDIHKVAIVELDGAIIISSDRGEMSGGQTRSATVRTFLERQSTAPESYIIGDQLIIVHPLRASRFTARPGDNITGAVEVVIDTRRAEIIARDAALRILAITLGSYLFLSLALSIILSKLVVRPIQRLTRSAERFRSGDHTARSQIFHDDEIGTLASTFNHMADEVDRMIQHLERRTNELRTEISQRQEVEQQLRESEELLASIYQVADVGICVTNDAGNLVQVNLAACHIFGVDSESLIGKPISAVMPPTFKDNLVRPDNAWLDPDLYPGSEWNVQAGDNRQRDVWATTRSFRRVSGERFVVTALTDITTRKRMEAQLYHLATHDGLTDLPNRNYFLDQLAGRIGQIPCAVLFFDLDKFKLINDSLGHLVGDQVLIEMARRLTHTLPPDVLLARFGGDEFLVLVSSEHDNLTPLEVASYIHETLRVPLKFQQQEMILTASIGIATASVGTNIEPAELIRNANIAMYQAKDNGRAISCVYDATMNVQALSRLQIQTELRHALERGDICLHYQPILALKPGQIVGFEALARWNHAERGLLMAGSFVPIAEESGLIVAFDWHMLREACQQTASFLAHTAKHHTPLVVHVNISGHTFLHPGLVEQVADTLQQSNLPPHCLVLEITETVAMERADSTIHTLRQLRALGVQVALDDFGIGYSSLRYLQQFPVQTIKIDASFVRTMEHDSGSAAIVETIISLARTLDMQVVAEGIETDTQCARLQNLHCALGQGKYISWAVPAEAATAMLIHSPAHFNAKWVSSVSNRGSKKDV